MALAAELTPILARAMARQSAPYRRAAPVVRVNTSRVTASPAAGVKVLPSFKPIPNMSIAAPAGQQLDLSRSGGWAFQAPATKPAGTFSIIDMAGPSRPPSYTSRTCPAGQVPITKDGVPSCLDMATGMDKPTGPDPGSFDVHASPPDQDTGSMIAGNATGAWEIVRQSPVLFGVGALVLVGVVYMATRN